MEKNLTGWSLGTICLFKQKKFMVGHFEVGRYFHGWARDSVKHFARFYKEQFISTNIALYALQFFIFLLHQNCFNVLNEIQFNQQF